MPSATTYRPRRLLFAALAGPIAWSVQLVVNYMVVEVACKSDVLLSGFAGLSTATWLTVAVTLLAAAGTLYGGWVAYRAQQRLGDEEQLVERAAKRAAFMAQTGVYLSVIFLLLILITGVPVLVLQLCA